jgi:hypothetical protein
VAYDGPLETVAPAVVGGSTFLLTFIAVQWPFADFLMRPASRNWVFGSHYFSYGDRAGFFYKPNEFAALEKTRAEFWMGIAAAFILAIVTTRIGLAWGNGSGLPTGRASRDRNLTSPRLTTNIAPHAPS